MAIEANLALPNLKELQPVAANLWFIRNFGDHF